MAWISIYSGVDGPKLRRLSKRIGCSKFEALGILNFLWLWGLENADEEGLIQDADREDIERYLYGSAGSGCELDLKDVVTALFSTGWIDALPSGMYLHDWDTWQEQWYKAKRRRKDDAARKRKGKKKAEEEKLLMDMAGDKSDEYSSTMPLLPSDPAPPDIADTEQADIPQESAPTPFVPQQAASMQYSPSFLQFWDAYPRKDEKSNAYKKYKARLNDGFSEEDLLLAAKSYAAKVRREHTEKRYIKQAKTFLSDAVPFIDYVPKYHEKQGIQPEGGNPFAEFEGL